MIRPLALVAIIIVTGCAMTHSGGTRTRDVTGRDETTVNCENYCIDRNTSGDCLAFDAAYQRQCAQFLRGAGGKRR